MAMKVTMLFNHTTNLDFPTAPQRRTGGWSESWYLTSNNMQNAIALATGQGAVPQLQALCPLRAQILCSGASIVAVRFQTVNPVGPSQTLAVNFPGADGPADVPQMGVLCTAPGLGVRNVRRFVLRGLADARVTEGEWYLSLGAGPALRSFFNILSAWNFQGRDLSAVPNPILAINSQGLVTLQNPPTVVANGMVRILKTKVPLSNKLIGGRFQVTSVGPGNQVQLLNWVGVPSIGGNMRADGLVYPAVDAANTNISRVVVKKVGRPFGAYRGRRSARKN